MSIKLYVAFYKGKDRIFNKLVSWWTRGLYSHTELVVEASNGMYTCWSSSFLDGGIRCKMMPLPEDHWDLVEITNLVDNTQDPLDWFMRHLGCKYDVIGLIGFIFRRVADDKYKFFCSEAIGNAIGIKEAWRFDPNALAAVLTSDVFIKK